MISKDFDQSIKFYEIHQSGKSEWVPIVEVALLVFGGRRITLPLLFDTGASITSLRADLFPILGLQSWDQGEQINTATANGIATVYKYTATFEVFGKIINCPVILCQLPQNPLFCGLLGRDTIFNEFGFGFWESTHELYVTTNP